MNNISIKIVRFIYTCLDRFWFLFAYILSTYLFYLPWLLFWRESFRDDNGIIILLATLMVFLSPLTLPVVLVMMGVELYIQVSETHHFLALGAMLLPMLYYAVVLTVSVFIVRLIAKRLQKWLLTKSSLR